jgi:steroid delta-isomerase-like uncharacterized protein
MSDAPNKVLYRRFVEAIINEGDFGQIPQVFSSSYVDHSAPPGAPGGLAGVEAVFRMFRGGFPDVHFTIQTMLAEGDKVATRVTGVGTHEGPFFGIAPTGVRATWASHGIFRVADGRIVEHWGQPDLLALLSQIGGIPPEAGVGPPLDVSHITPHPVDEPADPHDTALLERNKRSAAWAHEVAFSTGDVSEAERYIAVDYLDHPPARPYQVAVTGPGSLIEDVAAFRRAFPDLVTTAEDLVAEGNEVAVRGRWLGTHDGEFFGLAPTGRSFDVQGINFFRFADGQFVERFGTWDVLTFMRQLGLLPGGADAGPSHS